MQYFQFRTFAIWRLVAAMLVLIYHFAHYAPNSVEAKTFLEHLSPLLDMFFMVSGFLIAAHYWERVRTGTEIVQFLQKRFSRLYPLHLVTFSVFLAIAAADLFGIINAGDGAARYDFSQVLNQLLLFQAWGVHDTLTFNYVSWSLSAEWFAYLCFPLICLIGARRPVLGLSLLLVALVVLLEFADRNAVSIKETWYEARTWAAGRVLADFVFGALLYHLATRLRPFVSSLWPAWIAMTISIVGMFSGWNIYILFALLGCAIMLAGAAEMHDQRLTLKLAGLMPLASLSFGIYLWHPVIESGYFGLFWLRVIGELPSQSVFWWTLPVPALATILIAWISVLYVERPMAAWIMSGFGRLQLTRTRTSAA